jgi:hypothetical protein
LSLGCTRRRAAARLALHHHLTLMVPQQNEMPKGGRNAAKIARPTVSASVGDVSSKETSPRDNEASDLTRDCKIFGDSVRRLSVRNLDWRHGNRLTDGPAVVDRSGADSELTGKTVATLDPLAGTTWRLWPRVKLLACWTNSKRMWAAQGTHLDRCHRKHGAVAAAPSHERPTADAMDTSRSALGAQGPMRRRERNPRHDHAVAETRVRRPFRQTA